MRQLVMIMAALCASGAAAMDQGAQPRVVLMFPEQSDGPAILMPPGTPLAVTFPDDPDHNARFTGRLTLTGTYELRGYGEEAWVTLRPDRQSLASLPQWRERWEGPPKELYVGNGWDFAQAVVPKAELEKLKSEDHVVRGRVTMIVEDYETSVECDRAHYSARFVAIETLDVQMAEAPVEEAEGGC
jgi:hypothetical protein